MINIMNKDFILNSFMERHDLIHNIEMLEHYTEFLTNYKLSDSETYTEKHHILPVCTFPEFINEPWNIVELDYEDHKLAHKILFESIHIRQYQYPLNFMMNNYKDSEKLSIATKIAWDKLKSNFVKYNDWVSKRSNYMKSLSSDEQSRRAKIFWNNISEEERSLFLEKRKSYWSDEKKNEKSTQMKKFYTNEENVAKKSQETRLRWLEMSESERQKFSKKMSEINKDSTKRLSAGKKIMDLWQNESYLRKMKNRKHRGGTTIKLINVDGSERIFETMREMSKEYNFSPHLIRKYKDSGMTIQNRDLMPENMNLLGGKIIKI